MVTSPNSDFDKLTQDVSQIKQAVSMITKRLDTIDQAVIKLFEAHQLNEKRFDTRVLRLMTNGLGNICHELSHQLDHLDDHPVPEPVLRVDVVDGESVKQNELSVIVTRHEDGKYDFAYVTSPEITVTAGTESLVEYFNANPELMGDKNTLIINICSVGVNEDGQEG